MVRNMNNLKDIKIFLGMLIELRKHIAQSL